ncbi:MAG: peptidyl-prolyl cis-trans isomerase [Myxococcota bacterium]
MGAFPRLAAILASAALAVACGGIKSPSAEDEPAEAETRHGLTEAQAAQVLAKVGDRTITVGELAERLADQSPYLRARYNSPERRREFLDNMIRFELLAQEAQRRGLTAAPEVQRAREQAMVQQMMRELFEDRIRLEDVTDEEVAAYYEANRSEFDKPEQVRASHILITDRTKAERVLAEVLEDPTDIERFRSLAEANDEDPATQGPRRGDLRFFSRDGTRVETGGGPVDDAVPEALAAAAFGLEAIGSVHPTLVETNAGFHIVKLTGRRAALERSLLDTWLVPIN